MTGEGVRKKRVSGFRFYFLNILIGIVILGILLFLFCCQFCRIKEISYEGITYSSKPEIEAVVFADEHSSNMVYACVKNLISPPEGIPFVKKASVHPTGLSSVRVSVTEDTVIGYLADAEGQIVYFDSDGKVCAVSDRLFDNVTPVTGLVVEGEKQGEKLPVDESDRRSLVDLQKYLGESDYAASEIIFDGDGTLGFRYGEIFIDLGIPSELREKVRRLPYILPNLEGQSGTLHMEEWSQENTDIVFDAQ